MLKNSLVLLAVSARPSAGTASMPATPLPEATAIKLDGAFTEAIWEQVPARQRLPPARSQGRRRADVRDRRARSSTTRRTSMSPSARTIPSRDRLVGLRTRRDTDSPSDWLKVVVDSFHDRRTAFEFGVNPAGVKEDRAWSNDGNDDSGWDAVWDVAVSRDKDGWRAEFRIPFSQLRFHPVRQTRRSASPSSARSAGSTRPTPGRSSRRARTASSRRSAISRGLKLSQTPKRLELVPYVVGAGEHAAGGSRAIRSCRRRDQKATVGADLKYALRPGVTLTATVNPDFGQVEADPAVVNLSGFETFFSERRPFFVEGAGHVRLRSRLQRRQLQRPLLSAAHRPRAARRPGARGRHVRPRAAADEDPRRRQADRARRQVLVRRDERDDRRRGGGRRQRRRCARASRSSRCRTSPSSARAASSPTSRRSASW